MKSLRRFVYTASLVLNTIAGIGLVCIVVLIVVNTISRRTPLGPILGTYEFAGDLEAIVIAFAICFNQVNKANIAVDLLTARLSPRANGVVAAVMSLVSMIVFGAVTYGLFQYANDLKVGGRVSYTMHIPYYPLTYAVSMCFALLVLVLLFDCLDGVGEIRKNNE